LLPPCDGWDRRFRIEAAPGGSVVAGYDEVFLFVAHASGDQCSYLARLQDGAYVSHEFRGAIPIEVRDAEEQNDAKLAEALLLHLLTSVNLSSSEEPLAVAPRFPEGGRVGRFEYTYDGRAFEASWSVEGRWLRVSSPHGASRAQWQPSDHETEEEVGRKVVTYLIERNLLGLEEVRVGGGDRRRQERDHDESALRDQPTQRARGRRGPQ
jgi:hypothetical protein